VITVASINQRKGNQGEVEAWLEVNVIVFHFYIAVERTPRVDALLRSRHPSGCQLPDQTKSSVGSDASVLARGTPNFHVNNTKGSRHFYGKVCHNLPPPAIHTSLSKTATRSNVNVLEARCCSACIDRRDPFHCLTGRAWRELNGQSLAIWPKLGWQAAMDWRANAASVVSPSLNDVQTMLRGTNVRLVLALLLLSQRWIKPVIQDRSQSVIALAELKTVRLHAPSPRDWNAFHNFRWTSAMVWFGG
jgi:hypothetical protein